jgi:hypothetical protein
MHHLNLYYVDCNSGKKELSLFNNINHLINNINHLINLSSRSEIIAQREPIDESQSWYEKGEFPPVGEKVECHMTSWFDADKWIETSLICVHDDKIWIDGSDSIFLSDEVMFRPLKTREQKEKEEMVLSYVYDVGVVKEENPAASEIAIASKLYDMGWRKVDK